MKGIVSISTVAIALFGTSAVAGTFGCKELDKPRLSKACCGSHNAFSGQQNAYDDWKGLVGGLIHAAFKDGRGNGNPRSVCDYRNGKGVCVSWAGYTRSYVDNDLIDKIRDFSYDCSRGGASSQYYVRYNDGSSGSVCVSSNPNDCGPKF